MKPVSVKAVGMSTRNISRISLKIVRKLFINGCREEADRLVLTQDLAGGPRNIGGWCKGAVADRIADILRVETTAIEKRRLITEVKRKRGGK